MPSRSSSPPALRRTTLALTLRGILLGGAAATALASFAVQAEQSDIRRYDLPAGSLEDSLNGFAQAAGITLPFAPSLTRGKQAQAMHGQFGVQDGLEYLLVGSGLVATQSANGNWQIQPRPATEGALEMGPTTVSEAPLGSVTEGTNSYTTGSTSTATGLNLSLRETPQSVTVITRQKMDDYNLQTLKDVMKQTPGITVSTVADDVTFYARGGKINNFQMDGSRFAQSTSALNGPAASNLVYDDQAEIDHIEVLKGSAGLLQGDGYPSATVNMVRKKPTREFQAHVGASAGSWDAYRTDADISGPLTDNGSVRGRMVAAYKDANSYRDTVQNRNTLFYGTLDFDLTPDTLLNVGVDYKNRQNRGNINWTGARAYDTLGNFDGLTKRSWNGGAPWSGYNQNILTEMATLEHQFANGWEARLHLNHEKSEIPDWINASVNQSGAGPNLGRFKDMESRTNTIDFDLKGNYELFGRTHELLLGANYSRNTESTDQWRASTQYRSTTLADYTDFLSDIDNYLRYGGTTYPKPTDAWDIRYLYRTDTTRKGAYLTTRLNLADDLKLIVGGRISDYRYNSTTQDVYLGNNERSDEAHSTQSGVVTPYAGVVYDIDKNYSLYASYASVFQPVTYQDEAGHVIDPQEGVTYEVGSKAEYFDGRLNVSLAYFWKRWKNYAQVSGGQTPAGSTAYENVTGVLEHGYELEFSGELAPGLQAQGSYVMNNNNLDDNFYGLPRQQFKINTSYQLPGDFNRLSVGAGARWQSEIHASTDYVRLTQKAYWVTDIMARYKVNRHVSVGLNVDNLFDKKYFSGVNVFEYGDGLYYTWGEPRNINASVRYDF